MRRLARLTLLAFSLLVGCAHIKPNPSPPSAAGAPPAPTAPTAASVPPAPRLPPSTVAESTPHAEPRPGPTQAAAAPKPPTSARAKNKPRADTPAAIAAAAPVAPTVAPKSQLDFNSLEQRLRNTQAIGVFTKLSLKNQVDDLLSGFRGYYAGHVPPTIDDLRQRYDGLLLKVVTLVQDGDASLASAISASKGAIWERLSNRESFQAI